MTQLPKPASGNAVLRVRRALLGLTVITVLATAFELASVRHWNGVEQLIPWVALGVLAAATVLALLSGGRGRISAWVLAILVLGASTYGVIDHIAVNYNSGALDYRFADTWASMPFAERTWYALTKTVGPSPALAPGILGLGATLLLLASMLDMRGRSGDIPEPQGADRAADPG